MHPSLCIPNYSWHRRFGDITLVCSPPPHPTQSVWAGSIGSTSGEPGRKIPLSSPGSGAPTLIEDELLPALFLLVGGLQMLRCALKDTLLFGQSASQFQKFPSQGLSLGKGNRLSVTGQKASSTRRFVALENQKQDSTILSMISGLESLQERH